MKALNKLGCFLLPCLAFVYFCIGVSSALTEAHGAIDANGVKHAFQAVLSGTLSPDDDVFDTIDVFGRHR